MIQALYFYTSHTRRLRFQQLDSIALLTEQQLTVAFGPGGARWVDGAKWSGIEVSESETKPLDGGTSQQVPLYSVPQCSTEDLLKVAVRALECIHRFTSDTYARSALAEIEKAGWAVDWEGRRGEMCNIGGCTKAAEKGRYQCREHDK